MMINSNEHIHDLLGYEGIKIIQNDQMFRFSLDSMVLAYFVKTNGAKKIIDLGTGNAPIPLYLTLKTDAQIYGVEIQNEAYDLAVRSVQINELEKQITIINKDLKGIYKDLGANTFDIVTSNPPYFIYTESSVTNKNDFLTIARHEVKVKIEDIVIEARKLLADGGKFYLVHLVKRMPEILTLLERLNFGIKKLQLIYSKTEDEALLFLVEARKNKKSDLRIIEPLYLYDSSNNYTKQVLNIFNYGKNK